MVAITTIAQKTGHMRSSTAASLVGAAILSTLVFPFVGLRLRRDRIAAEQGTESVTEAEPISTPAPAGA